MKHSIFLAKLIKKFHILWVCYAHWEYGTLSCALVCGMGITEPRPHARDDRRTDCRCRRSRYTHRSR